jgi:hypothetical protein
MKKTFVLSVLIVLLSMLFIGASAKSDVWEAVRTTSTLAGRWEGFVNIPIPKNDESYLPNSFIEVTIFLDYIENREDVNASMKVDMNRFLSDWLIIDEIKAAIGTKDGLWDILVEEYSKDKSIVIGGKYFLMVDISDSAENIVSGKSDVTVFVDQNKTKLKMVFNEPVSFDLGDSGFEEIILYRK